MRRVLPPLNALRSFEAAARHGSFKAAAEELCVSHSAISHQVKLLEQYLGMELFSRRSRAVELTRAGRAYYPVLRETFDRLADSTALLLTPKRQDVLTIQLYSTFAIRWLIPRLPDFQAKHPQINVRLNTSQRDVDFEHEDVDACVMIGTPSEDDLHYTFLFGAELLPVCSPSLLQGAAPLKTPQDLARQSLLQVYPSRRDWSVWLEAQGAGHLNPDGGLQFDSYDHALSTAAQGLGVALGMQPYLAKDFRSGLLVEVFPGKRVRHDRDWYLVCRRERVTQPKIALFRDWLLAQVQADPDIVDVGPQASSPRNPPV